MIDMPPIYWTILAIALLVVWGPELLTWLVALAQRRQDETVEL